MTGRPNPPADLEAYGALIEDFRARSYEIRGLLELEPDRAHLALRHDVDLSLEAAARMSAFEHELGVSSIYFVLTDSELYNPAAPAARSALAEIVGCGHEIGLHFDAAPFVGDEPALEAAAGAAATTLEALTGTPVRMISFHKPAPELIGRATPVAGRRHAYEPAFVERIAYASDSRGQWGHGHPFDRPEVSAGRAIQLLTHPIWWTGNAASPEAALDALLQRGATRLGHAIGETCSTYAPPQIRIRRS